MAQPTRSISAWAAAGLRSLAPPMTNMKVSRPVSIGWSLTRAPLRNAACPFGQFGFAIAGRHIAPGLLQSGIDERRAKIRYRGIFGMIGEDDRAAMRPRQIDEFGTDETVVAHLERMAELHALLFAR